MLFNSIEYLIFLPIVFIIYWKVLNHSFISQNLFLLIASYLFYSWWDYRFLSLIIISTLVDYFVGLKIYKTEKLQNKKKWLSLSIITNIGILGFFKYFNFFVDSWIDMWEVFGYQLTPYSLKFILPVGISFYTFQTLSYTIDIFNGKLKPTKSLLAFATFVSFFPQLVAGPIERAKQLLPQIINKRIFDYNNTVYGLKLILWGMFKKIVVADSIAIIVDDIFLNYQNLDGSILLLGAILFSFQIYGDFSGYSDIAIGTSKLFGIELMSNFKFPYFSRDIAEFWRRWHISLSTWFRDYLYIPLGGSKAGKLKSIRNIFIIFIASGFWHGSNWTFIIWGLIHALLYLPLFIGSINRKNHNSIIGENNILPTIKEVFQVIINFALVTFAWIFFRSETVDKSIDFVLKIIINFNFNFNYIHPKGYRLLDYFLIIILFVFYEYSIRNNERRPLSFNHKYLGWFVYTTIIFLIYLFINDNIDNSFIYFQF